MSVDSVLHRVLRAVVPSFVRHGYWRLRAALQRRRIIKGREHEPQVCRALRKLVRPGDVCIDVGANVGLLSIFMAHLTGPTGRVRAFELFAQNVAAWKRNVAAAGVAERAMITQVAVSDGSRNRLTLFAGRRRSNAEWNITGLDAEGKAAPAVAQVPAASLDDCLRDEPRIDVVKIDVEGAEWLVLAGMKRILPQHRPRLLIECHTADNWKACAALTQLGYQLFDLQQQPLDAAADYPATHLVALPEAQVAQQVA
ncbi:MAG: FkbM family methyltransferase [Phycisphaeraceae bacterium]|nr:FkbM family methyltransferase [Phycisphaeraceae bacterium]